LFRCSAMSSDYRTIEGRLSPELIALHRNKRVVYHLI
jgi:hypothetical protein